MSNYAGMVTVTQLAVTAGSANDAEMAAYTGVARRGGVALEKAARAIHDAPWETLSQHQQLAALKSARAVLMAVRDLTEDELERLDSLSYGGHYLELIDAILAEEPKPT